MLAGRFLPLLAVLAIAGSLAGKRVAPVSAGTFRTDGPTFGVVLLGVVVLVALPDLRPRSAPRTGGPGHDRSALLTCVN